MFPGANRKLNTRQRVCCFDNENLIASNQQVHFWLEPDSAIDSQQIKTDSFKNFDCHDNGRLRPCGAARFIDGRKAKQVFETMQEF